ncbi:MAG: SDR family oxidoreductase [Candidatus Latescibacteria bacterium]|nr:SDR family oxidoreductase [Candidatus Latescibacterota bacterium]
MENTEKETIVIVGGAGGIGHATVRKYAEVGATVIIGDINEIAAKNLLDKSGDDVHYFPVDMMRYESIRDFAQKIKEGFGTVTHLINLAGGSLPDETVDNGIETVDPETISRSIDLNLKSHLYLVREFLPLIKADSSPNKTITLISSVNALMSFGQPAYSSAKAGMIGLVHSVANELGPYNIRINAVLPGTTPTPKCYEFLEKSFDALRNASALKRLSTPEDIAGAIYAVTHFMTSMTGQYIVADAGQTITYYYK